MHNTASMNRYDNNKTVDIYQPLSVKIERHT